MSSDPFISVIIPVWNDPRGIGLCLEALRGQTYPRERFEIIVVDNASTDDTPEVVRRFPEAQLLIEPIASSYRARNLGLRHAKGEFVCFTDGDCVPDPGWLAAAASAMKAQPDAGIWGGRIELFRDGGPVSRVAESYETTFAFNQRKKIESGQCVTANWASPRKLLLDLGGFNDKLKSGGDTEMSARIKRTGAPLVYCEAMLVRHPIRGTARELRRKYLRTVGGRWSMRKRNRFVLSMAGVSRGYVSQVGTILSNSELAPADKARLLFLVSQFLAVGYAEVTRLALGGEPRRS